MKKGQGLSVSFIILLILGLLVLVIVTAFIVQKTSNTGKTLKELEEKECKPPIGEPKQIGTSGCKIIYDNFNNLDANEVCCKIENEQKG